jgi:hypothetical protein
MVINVIEGRFAPYVVLIIQIWHNKQKILAKYPLILAKILNLEDKSWTLQHSKTSSLNICPGVPI